MCKWNDTIVTTTSSGKRVDVDRCLEPLVNALNAAGIETIACCCGHQKRPGNIALKDGRELIIAPDFETGREVDRAFPTPINE